MDFELDSTQRDVANAFSKFFDEQCSMEVVRRAEPLGFDGALWAKLGETGAVGMAVPERSGGGGGRFGDLAQVVERQGRCLAPVPLIESAVAARALSRVDESEVIAAALFEVLEGTAVATIAMRPSDGARLSLLPAGAVANFAIGLVDGDLALVELDGAPPHANRSNLGSMPIADRTFTKATVMVERQAGAHDAFLELLNEWKILTALSLVGLAGRAHEMVLEYVKHRRAFGTLIGSFQSVSHRLADDIVEIDGATFLSYEAAWAADELPSRAQELGSMAFINAVETARKVSTDALHLHGGIGYTMEHDVQLYFRRARAWPLVYSDPKSECQVLADRLLAPALSD